MTTESPRELFLLKRQGESKGVRRSVWEQFRCIVLDDTHCWQAVDLWIRNPLMRSWLLLDTAERVRISVPRFENIGHSVCFVSTDEADRKAEELEAEKRRRQWVMRQATNVYTFNVAFENREVPIETFVLANAARQPVAIPVVVRLLIHSYADCPDFAAGEAIWSRWGTKSNIRIPRAIRRAYARAKREAIRERWKQASEVKPTPPCYFPFYLDERPFRVSGVLRLDEVSEDTASGVMFLVNAPQDLKPGTRLLRISRWKGKWMNRSMTREIATLVRTNQPAESERAILAATEPRQ